MRGVLAVLAAQLFVERLQFPSELDHPLCGCLVASTKLSTIVVTLVCWRQTHTFTHVECHVVVNVKLDVRNRREMQESKRRGIQQSIEKLNK